MSLQPKTPEEVQAAVQAQPRLLSRGGGSKSALSTPPDDVPVLDLSALSGVLEYEPGEFTFIALAGTAVAEVQDHLTQHGQYLPFDPLLVGQGATLGGVVAANTSGPGRYRYGGVRDFLLGVQFVDGEGRLVRSGGKVVKNAAGLDLPKLMVGSLGRLGVLTELIFKVFPKPETYATLQVDYHSLQETLEAVHRLVAAPLDLYALDLESPGRLWVRIGGLAETLSTQLKRFQDFLTSQTGEIKAMETIEGTAEAALWQEVREFGWVPSGWGVVKVPLTSKRIPALEKLLDAQGARRRYSVGGNLAWVAWPEAEAKSTDPLFHTLDSILTDLGLAGLVLLGPSGRPYLGIRSGETLARKIKQVLDPTQRFLEV